MQRNTDTLDVIDANASFLGPSLGMMLTYKCQWCTLSPSILGGGNVANTLCSCVYICRGSTMSYINLYFLFCVRDFIHIRDLSIQTERFSSSSD